MHRSGNGIAVDCGEAMKDGRLGPENGDGPAMALIGRMREAGEGAERSAMAAV
jgi:hypothetical protein